MNEALSSFLSVGVIISNSLQMYIPPVARAEPETLVPLHRNNNTNSRKERREKKTPLQQPHL